MVLGHIQKAFECSQIPLITPQIMEYSTNLISEESQHKHEQGLKDGIYGYTEKSEYF